MKIFSRVQHNSRGSRNLFPSPGTTAKLFLTGGTLGPLVDSLHNQCLLRYDVAPINIYLPNTDSMDHPILATSCLIPPLLGIAYVVLGGVLPQLVESFWSTIAGIFPVNLDKANDQFENTLQTIDTKQRSQTAIWAVLSTALIIRFSQVLETSHTFTDTQNLFIMMTAALTQWILLDRTPVALVVAAITALGGPLSELPFVANGCWHYIPEASNYFPLKDFQSNSILSYFFKHDYKELSLSSITGPCYFAVTTDAIALRRWFDCATKD